MRRSCAVGLAVLAAGAALWGPAAGAGPAPVEVTVYAAASLRDVLEDLAPRSEAALGVKLVFNFGASNDLARQILAAAKADVFFSADERWMDRVAEGGLVDPSSRRSLLSNRLVVIGPAESALRITGAADLRRPEWRRIALANPEAVPAGRYAKAWLEKAGLWEAIRDRIVPTVDVRAALSAVEAGAVEAGVVYRTDAAISGKARTLYEVPESDGPRISYPLAAMSGRPDLEMARRVVTWLAGPEAARAFARSGFIVVTPPS